MPNLNKIFLIGNLTRDVELRYTPKGTAVATIGLAINRYRTDDEGRKSEETTFIDVELWARLAEIALKYLKKGSPCMIEGRLSLDTWEDKQTGQKRSKLRVVAENMQLLGSKPEGAPAARTGGGPGDLAAEPAPRTQSSEPDSIEIPF